MNFASREEIPVKVQVFSAFTTQWEDWAGKRCTFAGILFEEYPTLKKDAHLQEFSQNLCTIE